jgi:hypothetical protein
MRWVAAGALALVAAARAQAADAPPSPLQELLRLVPPDATAVVTVAGLREQVKALSASRLAVDLWQLPVVRRWLESEKYHRFERACAQIESVLGVRLTELRDEVVGDAFVLVLRLPPDGPPDPSQARGLFLLRARDAALLERVIEAINTTQQNHGELAGVAERVRGSTTYHVREFPAGGGRTPEWYVSYPDGTFAFSNSEALIQGVVDRKMRAPGDAGLGERPKFMALQRRLPAQALARLFVDPRSVERLLAGAARPPKPSDALILALLERYLAAVDYAGAALVVDSHALVLHMVETLDPSRVDPWLRRWAGTPAPPGPARPQAVPDSALGIAAAHLDTQALVDALLQLVPDEDQGRIQNMETVFSGLLMGQDLRTRILPSLGPRAIVYLDSPDLDVGTAPPAGPGGLLPVVAILSFSEGAAGPGPGRQVGRTAAPASPSGVFVGAALENALRTILGVTALDEKRNRGGSRIVVRAVAGANVTALDTLSPFAYAVDHAKGQLVLGTSAAAVARYLESLSNPRAGQSFRDFQSAAFASAETFVCVDLGALTRVADRHRDRVAQALAARQNRQAALVEKDLEHVLALARLFRAAFVSSQIEPGATAVHQAIGLLLPAAAVPAPRP